MDSILQNSFSNIIATPETKQEKKIVLFSIIIYGRKITAGRAKWYLHFGIIEFTIHILYFKAR